MLLLSNDYIWMNEWMNEWMFNNTPAQKIFERSDAVIVK